VGPLLCTCIAISQHNGDVSPGKKSYVDDCKSIIELKVKNGTGGTERRDWKCAGVVGKEQILFAYNEC